MLMPALQEALYSQPSMAGSVVDMSASWSAKVAVDFEQQVSLWLGPRTWALPGQLSVYRRSLSTKVVQLFC